MGFFGKVLVVILAVVVAWFGWRWWQRVEAERLNRPRGPAPAPPRDDKPAAPKVVDDLRRCPVCDDYVSINARRCERPTCPRG
jgi:uncharacterized protein